MRQAYSIDDIKAMLQGQLENVVARYAPAAKGSYTQHGIYYTLNPGRPDRRVGSFYIRMSGPKAGTWRDHAVPQVPGEAWGDVLDLIALSLGCDLQGAVREARAFLGLQTASPEDVRRRQEAIARAKRNAEIAAEKEKADAERRRNRAFSLWLSGQEALRGTPVDHYLRGRGIDLSRLGRAPRALRYVPKCRYYHVDGETGEVIEGDFPAMVAAINDRKGRVVAVHRTFLAIDRQSGTWGKAPVPKPKLVLGDYGGCWINLWRGRGPRGGKPESLYKAPPGTAVTITEGIEDALSAVVLCPEERVISAISLSNFGQVRLPASVAAVTLIADRDENETARAQLDAAIAAHQAAGRTVRIWQNRWGGKDLNDALRATQAKDRNEGAA